jgi:hypothetical protein
MEEKSNDSNDLSHCGDEQLTIFIPYKNTLEGYDYDSRINKNPLAYDKGSPSKIVDNRS